MSSTKHTPAPWSVSKKWEIGTISTEEDQTHGMLIPFADVYGDNKEANASLIVAAPELLEALAAVLADAKRRRYSLADNITEFARAAIAKARGAS